MDPTERLLISELAHREAERRLAEANLRNYRLKRELEHARAQAQVPVTPARQPDAIGLHQHAGHPQSNDNNYNGHGGTDDAVLDPAQPGPKRSRTSEAAARTVTLPIDDSAMPGPLAGGSGAAGGAGAAGPTALAGAIAAAQQPPASNSPAPLMGASEDSPAPATPQAAQDSAQQLHETAAGTFGEASGQGPCTAAAAPVLEPKLPAAAAPPPAPVPASTGRQQGEPSNPPAAAPDTVAGGGGAPASSQPPTPAHLLGLQAWLIQQHEAASAGGASAGGSAAAAGEGGQPSLPRLDLGGATLRDDPQHPLPEGLLRLPPGTRLANGKLEGCCVLVDGAGAEVVLERVEVCFSPNQGQSAAPHNAFSGIVTVCGAGSRAVLTACKVTAGGNLHEQMSCVVTRAGGSVQLTKCTLRGAPYAGLCVEDKDSFGQAEGTTAVANYAGFVAIGGRLDAKNCEAKENGEKADGQDDNGTRSGFVAKAGGRLEALERCVADDNGSAGFAALGKGAHLRADPGCVASKNGYAGFLAGAQGVLVAGAGCRATGNGLAGFYAKSKGKVTAGPGCVALGESQKGVAKGERQEKGVAKGERQEKGVAKGERQKKGFKVCGAGSRLVAEEGCRAEGHEQPGFYAQQKGRLKAGPGCKSTRNERGFMAEDAGTVVEVGEKCLAQKNKDAGYLATDGGKLVIGLESRSFKNEGEGFAAISGHMDLGRGCRAERNVLEGFFASKECGAAASASGGKIDASAGGCVAERNRSAGFLCDEVGSNMELGPESVARKNKGSGFQATAGGALQLKSEAVARGNKGWGLCVEGEGSTLRAVPGWVAEDNEEGPTCGNIGVLLP